MATHSALRAGGTIMNFHYTLLSDKSSRAVLAGIVIETLSYRGISESDAEEALASFDAFEAAVNAGDYEALNNMPGWNADDGMEYHETLDAIAYSALQELGHDD
jgi:hypothetical protein